MSLPFINNLRILQQHYDLTQAELARRLEISRAHLNNVQAGRRPVTLELVVRTADLFGVTIDFLLLDNVTAQFVVHSLEEKNLKTTSSSSQLGIKLLRLRTQRNLSQTDVARVLALTSRAYISNLEAGRKVPSLEVLQRIANTFDVTLEYLLRDNIPI